jgi:hypothetical protein
MESGWKIGSACKQERGVVFHSNYVIEVEWREEKKKKSSLWYSCMHAHKGVEMTHNQNNERNPFPSLFSTQTHAKTGHVRHALGTGRWQSWIGIMLCCLITWMKKREMTCSFTTTTTTNKTFQKFWDHASVFDGRVLDFFSLSTYHHPSVSTFTFFEYSFIENSLSFIIRQWSLENKIPYIGRLDAV